MKVPARYVDASVLGTCPASVDMQTGVVSINRSVWDSYDDFEKAFVVFHEVGHYVLDTDSEYEADAYALKHVYKTAPRSLKRSLQTLLKIRVIDGNRLNALYKEALALDAADGNADAVLELERINTNNFTNQKSITMRNFAGQETYLNKNQAKPDVRVVRRADGETNSNKSHKTNGIKVGGMYFSFTNILLMALIIVVLFKK